MRSRVAAAGPAREPPDADAAPALPFRSKATQNLVYSAPGITSGGQYKIYTGGTWTGTSTGGLAQGGTLGSATLAVTVTAGQAPAGGGMGGR
ncbi:hypothetical protein [Dactylosporangium sp. NPDC050588]|uniref:hypothetical protein n=1 Tax=Dactylosporangium sp. NPDC050588 TaxID=3157211 RepID=UPI0034067393